MTTFAIYTTSTGLISRRVECAVADAELNCQAGEAFVECAATINDETHMVDLGQTPPTVVEKPAPGPAEQLAQAKAATAANLTAAYNNAILAPVAYTTAAGATAIFNQQPSDIANLNKALLGSQATGVWALNLWQDASGAVVSPFTYGDLQGLAAAFEAHDVPEYAHLLTRLAEVQAATDLASLDLINW